MSAAIENLLKRRQGEFHQVVKFEPSTDKLLRFDFSAANRELNPAAIADTERFCRYVERKLEEGRAKFGIGGYDENRVLYTRSDLFRTAAATGESPAAKTGHEIEISSRSVHLGIDIWGPAGTEVFLPLGGVVHSFAFNDHFGDYGSTIIIQHQLETRVFHTLYGHLALGDLNGLQEGKYLARGERIAHFGKPADNGWWPPHLHFQLIEELDGREGDFPGVCTIADRKKYLRNCPNPDLVLRMMQYV
jgi:murein DD-endopeptidase MepM/ murein hydrolase activator NlpD